MTLNPVRTVVIGCGNISSTYLENAAKWDILDLRACANRTLARAQSQAEMFGGPVRIRRLGETDWREIPLTHAHTDNDRCLGVADLACALRTGRPHRANGELAYHVLDAMHAVLEAASSGQHIELTSICERPAPLPAGLPEYQLEES